MKVCIMQKSCCIENPPTSIPTGTYTNIYLCTPHYCSESVHPLTIADGFACLGGSRIQNNPNGKLAHRSNQPLSLSAADFPISLCVYICAFIRGYIRMRM